MLTELSNFYSDDGKRTATVMQYETKYMVQLENLIEERTQIFTYDNLQDAENKAEDWVMGEL